MIITRRKFLRRSMNSVAAAVAASQVSPSYLFAQSPVSGPIKNVVHVFLYGGWDARYIFPFTDGPLKTIFDNHRPNLRPTTIGLSGLQQPGRESPIGFNYSWADLLNMVQAKNCGLTLVTEYGVTGEQNLSHAIAQKQFFTGTNDDPKSYLKGWLARLVDTYQLPFLTVWGIGESEPVLFNSEINRPVVVSSLSSLNYSERNFGGFSCPQDMCSGHSNKYSTDDEDSAYAREVAKRLLQETKEELRLDQALTKTIAGIHPVIGLANGMRELIDYSDGAAMSLFAPTSGRVSTGIRNMFSDIARAIGYLNGIEVDGSNNTPQEVRDSTKVFCTAMGGWDSHENQDSSSGVPERLRWLGGGLRGMIHYLEQWGLMNETVIVVHSEFGRTNHENGSRGTDHGRASYALVLSGALGREVVGPEADLIEAAGNHNTPQVAFTGVMRQILRKAGFSSDGLERVFDDRLPNEIDILNFSV